MPRATWMTPSVGASWPGDQAQQRGLAAAVRADQGNLVAARDAEAEAGKEVKCAERLADVRSADDGHLGMIVALGTSHSRAAAGRVKGRICHVSLCLASRRSLNRSPTASPKPHPTPCHAEQSEASKILTDQRPAESPSPMPQRPRSASVHSGDTAPLRPANRPVQILTERMVQRTALFYILTLKTSALQTHR